jgi:asparagine synthase (glutamine-hydrolysing)
VASDHRFFPRGLPPTLVRRGETVEIGSMTTRRSRVVEAEPPGTLEDSADRLATLLESSVERRVHGCRGVAVSFSGGLDSSVIAMLAARHCEVTLCSAYVAASRDERSVERAADLLDLPWVGAAIDGAHVRAELRALDLPFQATPMDMALWCLYSTTGRLAAREGCEVMLLGQLADELFGGYMKYASAAERDETLARRMMEDDVAACAERAFVRDELVCSRFVEPRFPFADEAVVALGLGLPVSQKIAGRERKRILRLAASRLGLPEEIASAPKKAAQYSSGVAKLIP